MKNEQWIARVLDELKSAHLDRHLRVSPQLGGAFEVDGQKVLNFSSNDYLDLARHPVVIARAEESLARYGGGSTASRLLCGTLDIHDELEAKLAKHKGYEAAVVFGSGYMTNAGIIPTLVDRSSAVFADKLVHASIIDAVVLSGAKLYRFRHNDSGHLEELLEKHRHYTRRLVVTESVFSMDGDLAPLNEIASLAERNNVMVVVDEAHATGVFGPHGSGLVREHELTPCINVSMGTLSKGLGSYGGFAACSPDLRDLLINRARSFIYTTALPPAVIGASLGALEVLDKNASLGEQLRDRALLFREKLISAGLDTMNSQSQIVPIKVGDSAKALALAGRLRQHGILASAIRHPTVPQGGARLRLSVTLAHSTQDLAYAAGIISAAARDEHIL